MVAWRTKLVVAYMMKVLQAFGNPQQDVEPSWPVEVAGGWGLAVQQVPQVTVGHVVKDSNAVVCLTAATQKGHNVGVVQPCHDAHLNIELEVSLNTIQQMKALCDAVTARMALPTLFQAGMCAAMLEARAVCVRRPFKQLL